MICLSPAGDDVRSEVGQLNLIYKFFKKKKVFGSHAKTFLPPFFLVVFFFSLELEVVRRESRFF